MGTICGRRALGGLFVTGSGALALSGCAGTLTAVRRVAATVGPTASEAVTLYGIAKGVAEVASVAEPALAPLISAMIAASDPLVAELQRKLLAAQAEASAATQLEAQAKALLLHSAASVRVLPAVAAG